MEAATVPPGSTLIIPEILTYQHTTTRYLLTNLNMNTTKHIMEKTISVTHIHTLQVYNSTLIEIDKKRNV